MPGATRKSSGSARVLAGQPFAMRMSGLGLSARSGAAGGEGTAVSERGSGPSEGWTPRPWGAPDGGAEQPAAGHPPGGREEIGHDPDGAGAPDAPTGSGPGVDWSKPPPDAGAPAAAPPAPAAPAPGAPPPAAPPGWAGPTAPVPPTWASPPPPTGWGGPPTAPPGWGGPATAPPGWGGPLPGTPYGWGGPVPGAPRPGVVPLRPLGLGELLDGAVAVVRRYPRPTLGLSVVVASLSTVLGVLLVLLLPDNALDLSNTDAAPQISEAQLGGLAASGLGGALVTGLAGIVLSGVITVVVGRAVLGEPMTTGQAWQAVRPLLARLVGLALLTGLIVVTVIAVGVGLAALSYAVAGAGGLLLGVPAALVGLAAAVYLYNRLSLAAPALVLEKVGVLEALRRSGVLVHRSFWRVLGVLLLTAMIAGAVGVVLQVPFVIAGGGGGGGLLGGSAGAGVRGLVLAQIGSGVAQTLVSPFSSGVRALLYVDRRMRAEGLDVALAAASSRRT